MKKVKSQLKSFNGKLGLRMALFALGFSLASISLASAEGFAITKKIPVPGQGSWDYLAVDEGGRRLYVSHGTQVEVLDIDSGAIVGKIENTPGVHGIGVCKQRPRFNGHDLRFEKPEEDRGYSGGQ
jgi:hypothetical protein